MELIEPIAIKIIQSTILFAIFALGVWAIWALLRLGGKASTLLEAQYEKWRGPRR